MTLEKNTPTEDMQEFAISRIYVKDQSFEAPNTPDIFQKPWNPDLKIQLQARHTKMIDDAYEVVLQLTATVHSEGTIAFLAEVHQAGIFVMRNFQESDIHRLVGQVCPNILYPYARVVISEMVTHASFPSLYLAPVNFESLYEQQLKQQANSQPVSLDG